MFKMEPFSDVKPILFVILVLDVDVDPDPIAIQDLDCEFGF